MFGNLTRINNEVDGISSKVENFIEILHKKENELASAKELIKQVKRLDEVNKLLTGSKKDQDIMPDGKNLLIKKYTL